MTVSPTLWRQTLLKAKGLQQADIGRACKPPVPNSTVSRVVSNTYWSIHPKGKARRDEVRKVMAKMLGVSLKELFPPSEADGTVPPKPARADSLSKKKSAKRGRNQ